MYLITHLQGRYRGVHCEFRYILSLLIGVSYEISIKYTFILTDRTIRRPTVIAEMDIRNNFENISVIKQRYDGDIVDGLVQSNQ